MTEYTIERAKLGDEEELAYIQTESWKAGFKDILSDDVLQRYTQVNKRLIGEYVWSDPVSTKSKGPPHRGMDTCRSDAHR